MGREPNHLDIYRHLKKNNCGYCQHRTCMAFALAVARGERELRDCPHVEPGLATRYAPTRGRSGRDEVEALAGPLRRAVQAMDLPKAASGLGGRMERGSLVIPCLGRDFRIDASGGVSSDVHVNPWVVVPLLQYVLRGGTGLPEGRWIAFDELSSGTFRGQYFRRRCEEPLRALLDRGESLFADIMDMFGAAGPEEGFGADRAWLIHPLPRVPFLILYWRPEAEFESKAKILLDRRTEAFLDPESVYILARGLIEMFERLALRHEGREGGG